MAASVPKFLIGRGHYHCVMDSFLFDTDRASRLDVREERHEATHDKGNDRPPCRLGSTTTPHGIQERRYRFRICSNVFDLDVRVRHHEASHIEIEKVEWETIPLFATHRLGNMVIWEGALLSKVGAHPLISTESARLAIRRSICIRTKGDVRPDVHNAISWTAVFRLKDRNIAPCGKANALAAYDVRPVVWAVRSNSTEDSRDLAYNQGDLR